MLWLWASLSGCFCGGPLWAQRHDGGPWGDARADLPELVHLEPDLVARLQPRIRLGSVQARQLEYAAGAGRAAADHVTGHQAGAAGGVGEHLPERPVEIGERALRVLPVVDEGTHAEVERAAAAVGGELVRRHKHRAQRRRGILALD